MRRVLFIAYLFPPIPNSGTRRSLAFANQLPDLGWEPIVLSWDADPHVRLDPELLAEVRQGTRVERVPLQSRHRAERWLGWLPRRWRQRGVDALAWRLRERATVPDLAAGWLPLAVERAVRLHEELGFDVIYASGWPWTAFLIAREVSRRTGKPYVIDYRDQWTPSGDMAWEHASPLQLRENPALERAAARDAAAIITVTRTLVSSIGRDCGRDDLHLITNGFEPADFAADVPRLDDGLLRLSYTGVWRPGYGLGDLYAAIQLLNEQSCPELSRLRVVAAGFEPGAAAQAGVGRWVEELGPVPHGRAVEIMKQSDLLFLPVPLGYYAKASLPGKLFEYLACARPILAAVPQDSEVDQVLREVGGGLRVEPGDVPALAQALRTWLQGGLQVPPAQGIERYSRGATARRLATVLAAAAERRPLEPLR
ncbi:MAG: glycosyltransferase [Burkholderiales bacterium]|nr:MAG: glycosyltransferase [Burkholderiales bacterium]